MTEQPLHAVIDIGSNAIRLRIGALSYAGDLQIFEAVRAPVRLGRDVFHSGHFRLATIERAVQAFVDFRSMIDQKAIPLTQVRALATSAMRESANPQELIDQVEQATGIRIEVISGEEEAQLIYLAIQHALPELAQANFLAIDIGGGSVELIVSERGQVIALESFKMGTVRLLSQFSECDASVFIRLVDEFFSANARKLRELIDGVKIELAVGTGGNIEALGQLGCTLLGNASPKRLSYADLKSLSMRLDALDVNLRIEQLGLRPDRADVIVPACHILRQTLKLAGKPDLLIPGVGLAEGALLGMLRERCTPTPSDALAWARVVARRYHVDLDHAEHVRKLALELFDQLADVHGLAARDRLLIEIAALVHEIGIFVRSDGHHRHAYYLLNAMPMLGISEAEQRLLAAVVRAQRKKLPVEITREFNAQEKTRWLKLVALLRLAIALDKERCSAVSQLDCRLLGQKIEISCRGSGDFLLERWAVLKDLEIIEQGLGRSVEVRF